jgi:glycosyltransferase involved in cell wall biosynthesis
MTDKEMKKRVWLLQPGIGPYRIPLFKKISEADGIDLTVVLLCEHVPFQNWRLKREDLPFKTMLAVGINKEVKDKRVVHDRQIQFSFPLVWMLIRHRPDLVICSGFMFSTLLVYIVGGLLGIPYIIWNEGTVYTDGGLSRLKLWLREVMATSASGFIVAGTLSKEYVQSLLAKPLKARYYLSYNCVNHEQFSSNDDLKKDHKYISIRNRFPGKNLLFVGRLIETKGIFQLLDAYKDLVREEGMSDVGLIMLGEGRLEEYVKKFAADNNLPNIFLEGFVSQEDINAYYAIADVFVLLSLSDPNPLVIFEALAAGLPIVCSYRAGNAADFVKHGENGFVADPYNHEDAVNKLRMALEDIDRSRAEQVSRRLSEMATYESSAHSFLAAIRSVAKRA